MNLRNLKIELENQRRKGTPKMTVEYLGFLIMNRQKVNEKGDIIQGGQAVLVFRNAQDLYFLQNQDIKNYRVDLPYGELQEYTNLFSNIFELCYIQEEDCVGLDWNHYEIEAKKQSEQNQEENGK